MKSYFLLSLILVAVMVIFPAVSTLFPAKNETADTVLQVTDTQITDKNIKNLNSEDEKTNDKEIIEYLIGLVAGEMPSDFSSEALKAQTVASYTYIKYITQSNKTDKELSDLFGNQQKYLDISQQKELWGDNFNKNRKRIEEAVKSVYKEYLSYNGEPALTVFHEISSGKTKSAEEICGEKISYLTCVDAPGDILAENYENNVLITPEDFKKSIENNAGITLEGDDCHRWVTENEKDENGYMKTLTISSKTFNAIEISKFLNLESSSFEGKIIDNNFIFTVHGKGHGAGMSKYSADYMARQGKSYEEILEHFYPGTILSQD